MTSATTARAEQFPELDPATIARWRDGYGRRDPGEPPFYPQHIGLVIDEVRHGYCRMRMASRPELLQAGGVVHGGAIASLLDSVLVPAIGATLPDGTSFGTVDLHVQYLDGLVDDDAVAEGWVIRRGRRIVFGQAEARAASTGRLLATGALTYHVSLPR